ncbi:hypothetical protein ACRYCC_31335 [Actinomadura scrupuli]|uniref:hypothetical protein n=1 Tax=Actinomadura scrupuli TaxID=559629 RepID=UPI003D96FEB3
MATPDPIWNVAKCRRPGGEVPLFSGQDVINKLKETEQAPTFIQVWDAHPTNQKWDCTFALVFRVQLSGWTVYVVSHLHVKRQRNKTLKFGDGNTYIPGYANFSVSSPDFAFDHVPGYDANVHVDGWTNHAGNHANFWAGNNRYPI